ncbi:hypothetical protein D3C73_908910 [compost metagenome]
MQLSNRLYPIGDGALDLPLLRFVNSGRNRAAVIGQDDSFVGGGGRNVVITVNPGARSQKGNGKSCLQHLLKSGVNVLREGDPGAAGKMKACSKHTVQRLIDGCQLPAVPPKITSQQQKDAIIGICMLEGISIPGRTDNLITDVKY